MVVRCSIRKVNCWGWLSMETGEAMGSDILYEPKMQRTIGVDVRYILFMIEKYGKAGNLIQELNILN